MREIEVRARPLGSIPLPEVSGLALGEGADGEPRLLAIGDRAARVAWASIADGLDDLRWHVTDLAPAAGSWFGGSDPQLEAIAADGHGHVLLVREHPNRAELLDLEARRPLARVQLEMPDTPDLGPLAASWRDPDGSHAEGVVLLRGGRLLVVKEKDPAALVEFGPVGEAPWGFGPERWLAPGESWDVAHESVTLAALAVWYPEPGLRRACPDLLPDGDLLVACDRRREAENLFVVRRGDWAPGHGIG